jgi:carboxypeptidase family protein/TonB-dependent receptor-like protein
MTMRRLPVSVILSALLAFLFIPSHASAQNAEIAGVVRDASGAVLPGVSIEASSPALIERSRIVYTDSQGQYRVIALNPGEYKVTFSLTGFKTVVREQIVLTAAFTANVDASLEVGALEETVTVSGQSPLVDVQATTQRRALTSELIDSLPTGRSFQNIAILVPGVQVPLSQQDVGGSDGARWQTMKIHGSRDDQMPLLLNGMPFNNMNNTGGGYNHTLAINTGTVEEMTVTTSGMTAEARTSGVVANSVSKEGGNRFSYYFYGDFTNGKLQSNNLSQDLIDKGLLSVHRVKEIEEINPTIGGPIVKDRLWFYGGFRYLVSQKYVAGTYLNKDPVNPQYCATPSGCLYRGVLVPDSRDLTQQAFSGDRFHRSYTVNLTAQMSQKNKVNLFYHMGQRHTDNDPSATISPEAASFLSSAPDYLAQAWWTNPMTARLLFEAGGTFFNETWRWLQQRIPGIVNGYGPGVTVPKVEQSISTSYGAYNGGTSARAFNHQYNVRFGINYVTGSHAFKVGLQEMWGTRNYRFESNGAQLWTFLRGEPSTITQYARPLEDLQKLRSALGLYAQDRWTLNKLTLNLGLRFDYHNAYVPAQDIPALPFVGPKHYDAFPDAPSWKDLSPRLGFAWDITGQGKSVARVNYGHYVASESTATATANNPVNTRINSATRTWTDFDRDLFPDCDLTNTALNNECGPLSAPLGDLNIVTKWDPAILQGWGVRPNDDEILVGFQQQLTDRISADVQWNYHRFGNFFATERLATPPQGYDSYCVNVPSNPRLPNGGGNQICGFMDIQRAFFGLRPDNLVTSTDKFGDVTDVYTGFDATLTTRMPRGGVASGGVSAGRERTDFCAVVGKASMGSNAATSAGNVGESNISGYPSSLFCEVKPPYQPDWKGLISYPLPWWGVHASATWQNRPGPQVLANYVATSAETTLGRALTQNTATVNFIAPGTQYGDRLNQVDVRFAKSVPLRNGRLQASVSFFNLLNSNATLTWSTRYGPNWLLPTSLLQGRLVKFGAQLTF